MAAVSIAISLPKAVDRLVYDLHAFVGTTSREREALLLYNASLPLQPRAVELWQRELQPGDRYYVDTQTSVPRFPDLRLSLTLYLGFRLLPSVQVTTPREADVVLSYRMDPRRLGLRFGRIVSTGRVTAARVDNAR